MRRAWWFIGIILLVTGVLFEERHRARTVDKQMISSALADPDPAGMAYVYNRRSNFSDQVDLWGDPWERPAGTDASYAGLAHGNDPKPATFEKIQPRSGDKVDPVITVENRHVDYRLFNLGSFKLNVDLTPGYPAPEAWLPNRVDPGLSGSFSF